MPTTRFLDPWEKTSVTSIDSWVWEEAPDAYGKFYRSQEGAPNVEIGLVEDANFLTKSANQVEPSVMGKCVLSLPDVNQWFPAVL